MLDDEEGLEEAVIVLPAQPHRREPCDLYARGPISKAAGSPRDAIGLGGNAHLGTIGVWEGEDVIAVGNLMCKTSGKGLRLR